LVSRRPKWGACSPPKPLTTGNLNGDKTFLEKELVFDEKTRFAKRLTGFFFEKLKLVVSFPSANL